MLYPHGNTEQQLECRAAEGRFTGERRLIKFPLCGEMQINQCRCMTFPHGEDISGRLFNQMKEREGKTERGSQQK